VHPHCCALNFSIKTIDMKERERERERETLLSFLSWFHQTTTNAATRQCLTEMHSYQESASNLEGHVCKTHCGGSGKRGEMDPEICTLEDLNFRSSELIFRWLCKRSCLPSCISLSEKC
jgi:hypothetical protein